MYTFINTLIHLGRRGQHNFSKIVCLGLGLAVSLVIIAEVYYEQTFDTWFPDADRTYIIRENFKNANMADMQQYNQTSGAIAPGVKRYAPMVEAATRYFNCWGDETQLRMDDQHTLQSGLTLADSCFFDVFPRRILVGNAKQALSTKNQVLVSSDLAKRIGGNVVGRHFTIDDTPGVTFTIAGVYEAFPWGSSLHGQDALLSLCSIGQFSYDGRNNWMGNDSYHSYIRLVKGHDAEELQPYVQKMMQDNLPVKELQKAGVKFNYTFQTLNDNYTSDPYVKMMKWILCIVAFVLLFSSVMNYLLIVISNIVGRSREMAVRKCFGAERRNIYGQMMTEATVHVGLSVILAAVLVLLCKGSIGAFLSAPVTTLLFNRGSWILVLIIVAVLAVGGLVPGWLYNHTLVTAAFRGWQENRRHWKLGLLAVQFVVVGLMLSLLAVINLQYNKVLMFNPGYDYSNVAIINVQGVSADQRHDLLTELRRMPEVQLTASAHQLPIDEWFGSGNDVMLPGSPKSRFNATDLYSVDGDFFRLMNLSIVQGTFFTDRSDSNWQVMVDQAFARKLATMAHWKDGVVDKHISITEHCDSLHPAMTIVGVYHDIQLGGANHADDMNRPSMLFYSPHTEENMLVKTNNLTPDLIQRMQEKAERMFPGKKIYVRSYAVEYGNQYTQQKNFRNGIFVGGLVVLIIALFGLVGYTSDEVSRRSKEIAIRKVNGATVTDILRMFIGNMLPLAALSVAVGTVGAWMIAAQWLRNFTQRITLSPWIFLIVMIVILLIVLVTMMLNCHRVANDNPVKYLKDE